MWSISMIPKLILRKIKLEKNEYRKRKNEDSYELYIICQSLIGFQMRIVLKEIFLQNPLKLFQCICWPTLQN